MGKNGNRRVMSENIRYYMKRKGWDRKELSKRSGIAYTTITDWIKEVSYPRIDKIEKLALVLEVEKADLIESRNSRRKLETEANHKKETGLKDPEAFFQEYLRLNGFDQEIVQTLVSKLLTSDEYKTEEELKEKEFDLKLIPYYDLLPVSAGPGLELLAEQYPETIVVEEDFAARQADFAVQVKGDSMEPKYQDGDIVLVKSQPFVNSGEIGIFMYKGKFYMKVWKGDRMHSLNQKYNDIYIEDDLVCQGKVVGLAQTR